MIISSSYQTEHFSAEVTFTPRDPDDIHDYVWLCIGQRPALKVLMTGEQLRELQYLIDEAITQHDARPLASPIESLPMFVGDGA